MKTCALYCSLTLLMFLHSRSLYAHHSSAEYVVGPDFTVIEGELTRVRWQNPHIELRVLAVDEQGKPVEWIIEGQSAIALNVANVSQDLFNVGATVKVAGSASKRRPARMIGRHILLPGNVEAVMTPEFPDPIWSDNLIGLKGVGFNSSTGPLPDDGQGIFRVWTWEPVLEFWMMLDAGRYPLTERALRAQTSWDQSDPADNPVLLCEPPGMPATMGDPHPIQFVDRGDVIEIRMEEFDQVRAIHMANVKDPAEVPTSPLGYSVGRWEKDTLVVKTSRLNARYFNRHGVPQSEQAMIEERFTPDTANGQLNYVLTVTDPVNLREPFVQELVWNWNESAYLQRYDCASSLSEGESFIGSEAGWFSLRNALVSLGLLLIGGLLLRRYHGRR